MSKIVKPLSVFVDGEWKEIILPNLDIIIAGGGARKNLRTKIPKNIQITLTGEVGSKNQALVCDQANKIMKQEEAENAARKRGSHSAGEDPRSPRLPVSSGPDKRSQVAASRALKEGNDQPDRVGRRVITYVD